MILVGMCQYRGNYLRIMDNMSDSSVKKKSKNCFTVTRTNFLLHFPLKLCCGPCGYKESEQEKLAKKHYKQLEKEIHISYILKTLRTLKMIVREKFTPQEWRRAFSKYSKLGLSSDEDTANDNELNQTPRNNIELQQLYLQPVIDYAPSGNATVKEDISVKQPLTKDKGSEMNNVFSPDE